MAEQQRKDEFKKKKKSKEKMWLFHSHTFSPSSLVKDVDRTVSQPHLFILSLTFDIPI